MLKTELFTIGANKKIGGNVLFMKELESSLQKKIVHILQDAFNLFV